IIHISLRKFTTRSGRRLKSDYERLSSGNTINGLVLDLRYNSGGSAYGTRILLDYLIDKDDSDATIYSINNSSEVFYFGDYDDENIDPFGKSKFVLLQNEDSASASEITAGVLKHYDEALVLGNKSFGKGISQTLKELADESGIAIPFQSLLLPGEVDYHNQGIEPEIYYTTEPGSLSDDSQLDAAIQWINSGEVSGAEASEDLTLNKGHQRRDPSYKYSHRIIY
ncbi:MAG: hypothetical protein HQL32_11280, partial [Planctomycetes bacterium]|nr:hypothetical protein [Planctomycetota bacterium]